MGAAAAAGLFIMCVNLTTCRLCRQMSNVSNTWLCVCVMKLVELCCDYTGVSRDNVVLFLFSNSMFCISPETWI